MIHSETSRSGHVILKKDGRLLASSFDPLREAQVWARQAARSPGFEQAETLIVLGLGCGYHVATLAAHPKAIVVVEPNIEIAKATLEIFSFENNVKVLVEPLARQLLSHREIARALKTPTAVLQHQPSLSCDPAFYESAQAIFLSRDMASFLMHLRGRPELYASLDETVLQKLAATSDPVTIHTLRQLFRREGKMNHERRIWKALEELLA